MAKKNLAKIFGISFLIVGIALMIIAKLPSCYARVACLIQSTVIGLIFIAIGIIIFIYKFIAGKLFK